MWIVYTELHEGGAMERWFYGAYESKSRANEVALALGGKYPVFRCVCSAQDAEHLGVLNLPW